MDGTLRKEPGQPALSPLDVEPTSDNVRTSDAPPPLFPLVSEAHGVVQLLLGPIY